MKEIQFNTIQAFNDFHGFEIQENGLRNSNNTFMKYLNAGVFIASLMLTTNIMA